MMVRLPDAAWQVRNAPVKVLRGLFAGIGQLLLAADRFRAEEAEREQAADHHDPLSAAAGQSPGSEQSPEQGQAADSQRERARFRSLDSTGNVRVLPPGETAARDLPVPGYDGLSLPSLRSRLRNLDAAQLRVLVEYEKANAGRDEVVTMFKRRIAKLEAAARDAT
jgi:hypothetical protein